MSNTSKKAASAGVDFEPSDYAAAGITGSGAVKLASSAVAPLIAAARGYATVTADTTADDRSSMQVPDARSAQGKRLRECLREAGDLLYMPWFTWDTLAMSERIGGLMAPKTVQFRPSTPSSDPRDPDKKLKYENLPNIGTPMGVHPATPADWVGDAPEVVFFEGLLKADAALGAWLIHHGANAEDLHWDGDGDHRSRLRDLMERVETDDRILFVALFGVDNWHGNHEWNSLTLRDRPATVAFDADLDSNHNVWRAADHLRSYLLDTKHAATVSFLNPTTATSDGEVAKAGVDDYLAAGHTWSQLRATATETMPPRPPRPEGNPGDWRVAPSGAAIEECIERKDETGRVIGQRWVQRVGLGGRLLSVGSRRRPLPAEMTSGKIDNDSVDPRNTTAVVDMEVTWEESGQQHHAVISGPAEMLIEPPESWHRRYRGEIFVPTALVRNDQWPPRGKEGAGFLRAVKANRADEVADRIEWTRMGWLPSEDGTPVFAMGADVVSDPGAEDRTHTDVVRELTGADRFGLGARDNRGFDDDEYLEQVRRDILRSCEVLLTGGAWRNPAHAWLVLASALRPAIPLDGGVVLSFWGVPNSGKALTLDQKIPVPATEKFPDGWARNDELGVGDVVYAPDGTTTKIAAVSPVVDDLEMFEMELSDGRRITATSSHLWSVSTHATRAPAHQERGESTRRRRTELAESLRRMASDLSNTSSATVAQLRQLTGQSDGHIRKTLAAAGVPHETIWASIGQPRKVHGYDAREVTDALAGMGVDAQFERDTVSVTGVANRTGWDRKRVAKLFRRRGLASTKHIDPDSVVSRPLQVFPVAESLLALADQSERHVFTAPRNRVMTSAEVADLPNGSQPALDRPQPLLGRAVPTDVDPYTLGAWLGDGTTTSSGFTTADAEIIERIVAAGWVVKRWPSSAYGYGIAGLAVRLRSMGVLGNKHVPVDLLRASFAQRLELLRGLMDTDGSVNAGSGVLEFTSCSERLARDVAELIRTFGINPRVSESEAAITERDKNGSTSRRVVGRRWRVTFRSDLTVFTLARKARVHAQHAMVKNVEHVTIKSMTKRPPVSARCLTVDHPSGQFLAGDFIPTHNSYSAGTMMGFWSAMPGVWHDKMLPGNANDTLAATEMAVSRSPIWVVDDLTPSTSRSKADSDQAKIDGIVRAIHDNTSKRRAGASMEGERTSWPVHARVLVITSENRLALHSAQTRAINVSVQSGQFLSKDRKPTNAINDLCRVDGAPSRVTRAFVKWVRDYSRKLGWDDMITQLDRRLATQKTSIAQLIQLDGEASDRVASTASHLTLTIDLFGQMCSDLGIIEDLKELGVEFWGDNPSAGQNMLITIAEQMMASNRGSKPGRALVSSLRGCLTSGQAYVENAHEPGSPPSMGEGNELDDRRLAFDLGWELGSDDKMRPRGRYKIGFFMHREYAGEKVPIILFDQDTAFQVAQSNFPASIRPGQTSESSWMSVWSEGLGSALVKRRTKDGGETLMTTCQVMVDRRRYSGTPVELDDLFADRTAGTEDDMEELSNVSELDARRSKGA
ncbi:LAGLIDADG family homing endonuclease [Aeromicrobium sp. CTD01-1L150]|uniref:LAGLIDADG family homing endonuclease n=1 Tax=Aeromicrobium sp. CTD01-1L150 TaxID=3341830 RepID=UPI0035C07E9A